MIRVLVVDDSMVTRQFLVHILSMDTEIEVVGQAANGTEALDFITRRRPDVITMDMHMPGMSGFETTRRIMETTPIPVVIVSASTGQKDVIETFKAIDAGAVTVLPKPSGRSNRLSLAVSEFNKTIKTMAAVPVVRRWARTPATPASPAAPAEVHPESLSERIQLVAIGASTGGPPVLQTLLSLLPQDFPVPILVVQHIAAGFTQGMVEWLAQTTQHPVHLATHGSQAIAGHIYFAPDGSHLGVTSRGVLQLSPGSSKQAHCPSVASLFRSVADAYGKHAIGVLLTGMGTDGAREMLYMRKQGAITIAQDKETSVVYGMPGEANALGAAMYIMPPSDIAAHLVQLTY